MFSISQTAGAGPSYCPSRLSPWCGVAIEGLDIYRGADTNNLENECQLALRLQREIDCESRDQGASSSMLNAQHANYVLSYILTMGTPWRRLIGCVDVRLPHATSRVALAHLPPLFGPFAAVSLSLQPSQLNDPRPFRSRASSVLPLPLLLLTNLSLVRILSFYLWLVLFVQAGRFGGISHP